MTSCFKVPPSCLPYHGESCPHPVSQNKPFLPQAALARYFVIATKTPEGPGRKQTYSESLYGAFRKATLIEDQGILQGTSGELSHAEGTSLSVTEHSKFRPSVQTHERPGWVGGLPPEPWLQSRRVQILLHKPIPCFQKCLVQGRWLIA